MTEHGDDAAPYAVHEVVGVFPSAAALEAAVAALEAAGFGRAAISVLSGRASDAGHVGARLQCAREIADDPAVRQTFVIAPGSRTEGGTLAVAAPAVVGVFAGAWASAAAGGALIGAIGATVVGGAFGAGLGALLLYAVASRHATNIHAQLTAGGIVLWVITPDAAAEQLASAVLKRCGGMSIHAHTVEKPWGVAASPLHDVQPDPFLVRET